MVAAEAVATAGVVARMTRTCRSRTARSVGSVVVQRVVGMARAVAVAELAVPPSPASSKAAAESIAEAERGPGHGQQPGYAPHQGHTHDPRAAAPQPRRHHRQSQPT